MRTAHYAWCFSHGATHTFPTGTAPWCTGLWIAFTATTEAETLASKCAHYGEAQYLDELPVEKQIEVIETTDARADGPLR
ncbi:hypothetical protein ASD97_24910 [Streptomyces sp. Root63]|uniref:hypothetical protein n=1 Tax=unclassified Streptomyces TaxID=2593676 RepID=UPI0006FEC5F0|nr:MULTISPECIES: hypothetical protein [unclassified Streptomyces]KQX27544.1 hypothetical protein ASD29_30140 [Streptomyces sp. Root1295]KRA34784.1 hypothetical protein ASD97_24910 [Streptomyces sp. Root63]